MVPEIEPDHVRWLVSITEPGRPVSLRLIGRDPTPGRLKNADYLHARLNAANMEDSVEEEQP